MNRRKYFLWIYCKLLLLLIYFDEIFTYVDIFAKIITNVIPFTFSWTVTSLHELLLNCRNRFTFAKIFTYFRELLQISMICCRFAQNCLQIESGTVKGAIPVLSYSSAAVCLALNCILPGVGQLSLLHMMSRDLGWLEGKCRPHKMSPKECDNNRTPPLSLAMAKLFPEPVFYCMKTTCCSL